MSNPVSGESSAKGFSVIIPYIAVGPAAVAIRRPELGNAWNLAGRGRAWRGTAWRGKAWQGKESGMARQGPARHGKESGVAGLGLARRGTARPGMAGHERGKELGLA